jgi:hypothetical protein
MWPPRGYKKTSRTHLYYKIVLWTAFNDLFVRIFCYCLVWANKLNFLQGLKKGSKSVITKELQMCQGSANLLQLYNSDEWRSLEIIECIVLCSFIECTIHVSACAEKISLLAPQSIKIAAVLGKKNISIYPLQIIPGLWIRIDFHPDTDPSF